MVWTLLNKTPTFAKSNKLLVIWITYRVIIKSDREGKMKKLAVQLFVWAAVLATYAMPVLASGGGGR